MKSDNINLEELLQKYENGSISKEELLLLEEWLVQGTVRNEAISELEVLDDLRDIRMRLTDKGLLEVDRRVSSGIKRFYRAMVAAAILFCVLGLGLYVWKMNQASDVLKEDIVNMTVVQPGEEKAVLVLSNGEKVVLDGNMELGDEMKIGKGIEKTAEGWLSYSSADENSVGKVPTYHTLIVPKRSKYGLQLEDGTKIWLNAGSSLRFPDHFVGGRREVELDGEAYFEVQPRQLSGDKGGQYEPFIVKTKLQQIQVLGTQFNVSAYREETSVLSTLIEGKVEVTVVGTGAKQLLKPNQQSVVGEDGRISVKEVDAVDAKAWMDGSFVFANENLETILRRISRWYDIDVQIEPGLDTKHIHLYGSVDKFAKLKDLLDVLEMTKSFRFEVKGGRLLVKKKG